MALPLTDKTDSPTPTEPKEHIEEMAPVKLADQNEAVLAAFRDKLTTDAPEAEVVQLHEPEKSEVPAEEEAAQRLFDSMPTELEVLEITSVEELKTSTLLADALSAMVETVANERAAARTRREAEALKVRVAAAEAAQAKAAARALAIKTIQAKAAKAAEDAAAMKAKAEEDAATLTARNEEAARQEAEREAAQARVAKKEAAAAAQAARDAEKAAALAELREVNRRAGVPEAHATPDDRAITTEELEKVHGVSIGGIEVNNIIPMELLTSEFQPHRLLVAAYCLAAQAIAHFTMPGDEQPMVKVLRKLRNAAGNFYSQVFRPGYTIDEARGPTDREIVKLRELLPDTKENSWTELLFDLEDIVFDEDFLEQLEEALPWYHSGYFDPHSPLYLAALRGLAIYELFGINAAIAETQERLEQIGLEEVDDEDATVTQERVELTARMERCEGFRTKFQDFINSVNSALEVVYGIKERSELKALHAEYDHRETVLRILVAMCDKGGSSFNAGVAELFSDNKKVGEMRSHIATEQRRAGVVRSSSRNSGDILRRSRDEVQAETLEMREAAQRATKTGPKETELYKLRPKTKLGSRNK